MSSGFVDVQAQQWGHKVVIITIKGAITQAQATAWNTKMDELKAIFGNNLIAVTLVGEDTPPGHGGRP
jgi:hypothetical protein